MDQKPPSPSTSPNSSSTSTSSNNNNNNNNGEGAPTAAAAGSLPPPITPKSIPNPNQNSHPYPTTFIQADTQSFKQVVQMLTGSAETAAKRTPNTPAAAAAKRTPNTPAAAAAAAAAQITPAANPNSHFTPAPPKNPIPPISRANKKPAFKLYERRSSMKNLKMITTLNSALSGGGAAFSPRKQPEILSPSVLDFPSLVLSPVTPLSPDPFNRSPHTPNVSMLGVTPVAAAEDRGIAENGFYLHPSPRPTTPRDAEPPKLLPLFPLTSPRMESSSN